MDVFVAWACSSIKPICKPFCFVAFSVSFLCIYLVLVMAALLDMHHVRAFPIRGDGNCLLRSVYQWKDDPTRAKRYTAVGEAFLKVWNGRRNKQSM
jgi:hypothetical protein